MIILDRSWSYWPPCLPWWSWLATRCVSVPFRKYQIYVQANKSRYRMVLLLYWLLKKLLAIEWMNVNINNQIIYSNIINSFIIMIMVDHLHHDDDRAEQTTTFNHYWYINLYISRFFFINIFVYCRKFFSIV